MQCKITNEYIQGITWYDYSENPVQSEVKQKYGKIN